LHDELEAIQTNSDALATEYRRLNGRLAQLQADVGGHIPVVGAAPATQQLLRQLMAGYRPLFARMEGRMSANWKRVRRMREECEF